MTDKVDSNRDSFQPHSASVAVTGAALRDWFVREVLPLEAALTQFLRHNWRNKSDIADLVQEVYARVYDAARKDMPEQARPFVFATAHNLLVDRVRREKIVQFEAVSERDTLAVAADDPSPDRSAIARDELRRLQIALDRLPPRTREVVTMRRIDGLARAEIAQRLGISEVTVKWHLNEGLRALADDLYGEASVLRGRS
jgi:RNA polymerase sigma-70 factor (ECF subfamily)